MIAEAGEIRERLAAGATLPAHWYVDEDIARLEEERIFTHAWQYAGPAERVDEARVRLPSPDAAVERWGPLVFVNPDPAALPLGELLGDLPELIASSGLDLGAVRFRQRVEWELPVNWKVAIENYLECYHCPVAHPSFSKLIDVDPDAYRLRAGAFSSSQFAPVRASARAEDSVAPYVPDGPVRQAQYHFVWPHTTINVEAGGANLSVDATRPAGPERSIGFTDYFFADDVDDETARAIMDFASQVAAEDAVLCESVQRGLSSGMIPHGRLLLSSEHLIQHFQRLVFDALAG